MSAWTVIAHTEVGSGGAADITFSSISGSYTDLFLAFSLRPTNDTPLLAYRFNGSNTGYSVRNLYGTGSLATSSSETTSSIGGETWGRMTGSYFGRSSYTASTFSNGSIYIPNYAGSTNKSFSFDGVSENNATAAEQYIIAGLWSNTAAITSIALKFTAGDMAQYSSATLYGITKGSSGGVTVS